jgi:hypothetical protein
VLKVSVLSTVSKPSWTSQSLQEKTITTTTTTTTTKKNIYIYIKFKKAESRATSIESKLWRSKEST